MKRLILLAALVGTGAQAAEKPYDYRNMLRERQAAVDAAMGLGYPTTDAADAYVVGLSRDAAQLLPRHKIPIDGAKAVCNDAVNVVLMRELFNLTVEHPEVDDERTATFGTAFAMFAYHQCLDKGAQ